MIPIFQAAIGVVNGSNTEFETATDYKSGTVVPHLNGQALPGWKLSEGPGKKFTVDQAPQVGDDVEVYYLSIV